MEREKALGEFREKAFGELTGYRERMAGHLLERADELTALVQEAAGLLGRQMKERQKEEISFLYGSILKTDLLQGKYRFFFHAMDSSALLLCNFSPLQGMMPLSMRCGRG